METPERSARRPLDATALARVTRRLQTADQPPWLHGEVARRMAERLPIVKLQPRCVIDWGSFIGASREVLQVAYPQADYVAVEADARRCADTAATLTRPWWSPQRWAGPTTLAMTPPQVPAGQGQLLWANMVLHGMADPQQALQQWQAAVAVDGFLMFSTLGPGTLEALSALYRHAGWPTPFAPFVDMHDLGDMLLHAGFADPVMDQETITLTWPNAQSLLDELRTLGGNVALDRPGGLRTPRWRRELMDRLQAGAGPDGRLSLAFEIVYGHAFRPPPKARVTAETAVPLADLRAMVKAGRRGS